MISTDAVPERGWGAILVLEAITNSRLRHWSEPFGTTAGRFPLRLRKRRRRDIFVAGTKEKAPSSIKSEIPFSGQRYMSRQILYSGDPMSTDAAPERGL
jgi:hypothetical protein